ncbi:hypothetical protein [Streptomyces sp. SID13031]|uniref:hypothetical protein n=1 Tax=Streptomyces sp. SID13031 TaxID=2706046 RepID=UPI0013C98B0E|nr:hypothetical protein [Streptomyces sp. SID13031]NEA32060.1 hypothetical protein [Streptomyces sp. SID13031]
MSLSNPSPRRMTNRGTRTLKAAYAQAARDVKRMDPAVLAAVGRSKLNSNDLKHLAHANINGLYGPDHERFAQRLNAQAAAQIQATTPATQRTRNPFKKLSNRRAERKDIRQGKHVLQMAYAQAKSEVKRIDPAVRQGIGHSRVSKQDLSMLSHSQLSGALRAGIEQAAQHHFAQARVSAAAVAAQPPRQSAGQRVANVVNTASRWTQAVRDGANSAKGKAEQFRADYNERRQNPTGRGAQPTAAAAAGAAAAQQTPDLAAQKAAQAKAVHVGLNTTVPMPTATQEAGDGHHRGPESAAAFDGIAPAGRMTGVQLAYNNSGPVTQTQSNSPQRHGGTPGADPAMAPASGAVAPKPGSQQPTTGQGEATPTHNKHHKPDSQGR